MGSSKGKDKGKTPAPLSIAGSGDTEQRHDSYDSGSGHGQDWYERSSQSRKSSASSSKSSKPTSPVNVYTHCGRHSDQWLFSTGGRSMSDYFRFGKKE